MLRHLPLAGQRQDADLLEAIDFLKACFDEGRSLARCRFEQIPKAFIPQSAKPYLYEKDADGLRRIHPDKYEFLVYRMLRNRLEAGDIYVSDSRTAPTKSISRSWRSSATNSRRATKTSAAKWERCTASKHPSQYGREALFKPARQGERQAHPR